MEHYFNTLKDSNNPAKIIYREIVFDKLKNTYYLIVSDLGDNEYRISLQRITKIKDSFFVDFDFAGYSYLDKCRLGYRVSYDVEREFQGLGLGSLLVEFTKKFTYKHLGAKKLLLDKMYRGVPYVNNPNEQIDGNLQLYLNHNFKLDHNAEYIKNWNISFPSMSCDLEAEFNSTNVEISNSILNNKLYAYTELDKIQ